MALWKEFEVLRVESNEGELTGKAVNKDVISESTVEIYLNGEKYTVATSLEGCFSGLALGLLFNEGIINTLDDVSSYEVREVKEEEIARVYINLADRTSAKQEKIHMDKKIQITARKLFDQMRAFMKKSDIFQVIGGAHSVMLVIYDGEGNVKEEIFAEDIGRHNCFDKVAGRLVLAGLTDDTDRGVIFTSGRLSSEIMSKIIRMGIPLAVSRSTPTAEAVELANKHNVTVMGFVRGSEGVLYSHRHRVIVQ